MAPGIKRATTPAAPHYYIESPRGMREVSRAAFRLVRDCVTAGGQFRLHRPNRVSRSEIQNVVTVRDPGHDGANPEDFISAGHPGNLSRFTPAASVLRSLGYRVSPEGRRTNLFVDNIAHQLGVALPHGGTFVVEQTGWHMYELSYVTYAYTGERTVYDLPTTGGMRVYRDNAPLSISYVSGKPDRSTSYESVVNSIIESHRARLVRF
ncbi:MAG: hypothetical protein IPJ69_00800 [Deltaproteobacteria bacterium]|nr:MAG: hypothetical protein IPJ69_00800 [Deltaproteobacteria bacterium]